MRGRTQAIGVSVVAALLPFLQWLSTATVSLVVLRHGLAEGALVLMWASLPMFGMYWLIGDITPVIMLFGTVAMAYTLRATASWEMTLLATVVLASLGNLLFEFISAGVVDEVVNAYRDFMLDVQSRAETPEQAKALVVPTFEVARPLLLGYFAMGYAISMLLFLLLARWWQSLLYNPGGFQQEFQGIRLSPIVAAGLVVLVLGCFSITEMNRWVLVLTVPLIIAGLAFVHWFIKEKQFSSNWLVGFYFLALLLQLFPVLAFLALMDSWFDLRNKIRTNEV
jgi:lipoprotein signal peptidase